MLKLTTGQNIRQAKCSLFFINKRLLFFFFGFKCEGKFKFCKSSSLKYKL